MLNIYWVLTGDKVETVQILEDHAALTPKMNRDDGSLYVIDPDENEEVGVKFLYVNHLRKHGIF